MNQDVGFLYGYGLFESIHVWQQRALFLEEHLCRLIQSAKRWYLACPEKPALVQHVEATIQDSPLHSGTLKIVLTGGQKSQHCTQPYPYTLEMEITPYPPCPPYVNVRWIDDPFARSELDTHKSLTYFRYAYIKRLLKPGEEVVLVDHNGHVLEGLSSSFFGIKNGQIMTPPLGHILPGIIRNYIINHHNVVEAVITREAFEDMDEVFLTNSISGIILTQKSGPVSRAIQQAYRHTILGIPPSSPL